MKQIDVHTIDITCNVRMEPAPKFHRTSCPRHKYYMLVRTLRVGVVDVGVHGTLCLPLLACVCVLSPALQLPHVSVVHAPLQLPHVSVVHAPLLQLPDVAVLRVSLLQLRLCCFWLAPPIRAVVLVLLCRSVLHFGFLLLVADAFGSTAPVAPALTKTCQDTAQPLYVRAAIPLGFNMQL
jgi:hypothetical protein